MPHLWLEQNFPEKKYFRNLVPTCSPAVSVNIWKVYTPVLFMQKGACQKFYVHLPYYGVVHWEGEKMVYCTKCGTNNVDGATVCVNCGASLYGASGEGRLHLRRGWYEKEYGFHKRGNPIVGLIVGIIVIFIGASFMLREYGILVPWWEILLILFGIYLVLRGFCVRNHLK